MVRFSLNSVSIQIRSAVKVCVGEQKLADSPFLSLTSNCLSSVSNAARSGHEETRTELNILNRWSESVIFTHLKSTSVLQLHLFLITQSD